MTDDIARAGLVWLSSYPKSGNTWTRAFFTRYFEAVLRPGGAEPGVLSRLMASPMADDREHFDELVGLPSGEMAGGAIDRHRPLFHALLARMLAEDRPPPFLMKTHYRFAAEDGRPNFAAPSSDGAIVIVRNPLDVAASYANHAGDTVDGIIGVMAKPDMQIGALRPGSGGDRMLPQKVGSWSGHVGGWVDCDAFPVRVIRYEDMLADPGTQFAAMLAFLGLSPVPEAVREAVDATRFDALRREEAANGFMEMPDKDRRFFHKGLRDGWRTALTPEQVRRIVEDHAAVMDRFGYREPALEWLREAA